MITKEKFWFKTILASTLTKTNNLKNKRVNTHTRNTHTLKLVEETQQNKPRVVKQTAARNRCDIAAFLHGSVVSQQCCISCGSAAYHAVLLSCGTAAFFSIYSAREDCFRQFEPKEKKEKLSQLRLSYHFTHTFSRIFLRCPQSLSSK